MFQMIYQATKKIRDKISGLNEKGQGMVEYAIIIAVVAAVAFTVFGNGNSGLSKTLNNAFEKADTKVNGVVDGTSNSNSNGDG